MAKKKVKKTEKPRIGVFVCHCGKNIAQTVDVGAVTRYASKLPGVVISRENEFMCSEAGQDMIREAILKHKLERVVVASCSPRLHEHTFRAAVSQAGLNPFHFEMANIRENVSWVHHEEPKKATEKAKHIIKGAVARAAKLEPIGTATVRVEPAVMVIGGGVAGIQAALDVADNGVKVYLVEKNPSIGGMMARLVETFPTGDCSMCILSPKMAEVARNGNIELITNSTVEAVNGYIGNFQVKVRNNPRYVEGNKCIGCGDCSDKCPVKIDNEWDMGLGKRKAIYLQFPQALPRTYIIDKGNCLKFTKDKCGNCAEVCPAGAVNFKQKVKHRTITVGTIIVATGTQEYDPGGIPEYGYSDYDDVITQLQLARMMDPAGPTKGKIIRPSGADEPRNILMLQCVGSRDDKYNPYCSRVCCMSAIKHAVMIKTEQDPDSEVSIAYTDIRTFGKGYEEYYKRASEMGIRFIRSRTAEVLEENGDLVARLEDTDLGEPLTLNPDLVVLSTGLVPYESSQDIAKALRLETDPYNFFTEKHLKLAPVDTKIAGIHICGTASGPKDIPDSVAQARAAAVAALTPVLKGVIEIDLAKAEVDGGKCDACKICVEVCPYEAVALDEGGKASAYVIEALCKACGICSAECPTGAIQLRHYKGDQIMAQIDAIAGGGT